MMKKAHAIALAKLQALDAAIATEIVSKGFSVPTAITHTGVNTKILHALQAAGFFEGRIYLHGRVANFKLTAKGVR